MGKDFLSRAQKALLRKILKNWIKLMNVCLSKDTIKEMNNQGRKWEEIVANV